MKKLPSYLSPLTSSDSQRNVKIFLALHEFAQQQCIVTDPLQWCRLKYRKKTSCMTHTCTHIPVCMMGQALHKLTAAPRMHRSMCAYMRHKEKAKIFRIIE